MAKAAKSTMQTTKWQEVPHGFNGATQIEVYDTEVPDNVGRLAIRLVEHFGVIAFIECGEDSAGRQKFRLGSPDEVAKRAVEIAEETWMLLQARGHSLTIPEPKPGKSDEEMEAAREERRRLRDQTNKAEVQRALAAGKEEVRKMQEALPATPAEKW